MKQFFSLTQLASLNREFDKRDSQINSISKYVETNVNLIDSNVEKHNNELKAQLSALEQELKSIRKYVIISALVATIAIGCSIYAIN